MANEHETLAPHRKQKVRAFLRKFDDTTPEAGALWAVVFSHVVVEHSTAIAVAQEFETSDRTVGDVLDGWKPVALHPYQDDHGTFA